MKQEKKQEVFFLNENSPYKASLSTEELYTEVHGESSSYGTSAKNQIKCSKSYRLSCRKIFSNRFIQQWAYNPKKQ